MSASSAVPRLTPGSSLEESAKKISQLPPLQCCLILTQHGFGSYYDVQPSDWGQYYETDELRDFAIAHVFPNAE
jgi:hypothetical protein